jgi:hypothetical protein
LAGAIIRAKDSFKEVYFKRSKGYKRYKGRV